MNLAAGALNNYASQVIAGGTLAGDSVNGTAINNTGPLGRQRVVSTGSAVYTYIKSHSFSADDRRYDGAPYQSQDIVTNFQLDVSPTSGAGPNRANSVRAVPAAVSGAAGASAGAASNRDNAIGSTVQGKDISVTAGRDINAQAAYVNAEGSLSANAANNINIGTDVSTASARDQHKKTDAGGVLSSRTVTTDDSSSERINQGTTLSGNTVVVRAGKDINVIGSNVVATQGVGMAAGNDVNIVAAVDSSTKNNFRTETTSGVMGAGFGVTIGTREQSHDGKTQGQTASASTIGSTDGNVSIVAGDRYTQVGSDVMAPKGDIDIAAKSVEIRAAEQASKTTTEDKYKQSGLTVAVTSPVISAMQTVDQMVESSGKTKNGRVKALAAATAGMSLYSAAGEMQKAGSAEGGSNIGISATLGSSQNGSRSEQNTVTQRGSTVASGGNMNIRATGDGANSNITIAGSDINAKGNLALKADNDINLIAAQNSDEQHSTRSSSSWGVGITAQIGSESKLGITANAAGSRGKSDGKDVSNVMTQVRAGGQVKIDSGRDTNLIGATVSGEQVVANVGRDLNIASVQDTSTFKSRDQSIGGSATIGYGSGASISASRSRVDADYASVGQQAGITSGNGGFQINVKGNTDLKGAQIASTDQAVEQGRNSLTTGTLTSSEIQNRSQYSAESQSASAGTSGGKPGGGIGIGNASGSETSVTRSGVSGAAVTITDAQAQQARTGQSADQAVASLDASVRTGKDSSNSLAKSWDGNQLREDVEAQAKITQAFGQQAAKMVGSYADAKEGELRRSALKAAQDGDQAEAAKLSAEADQWKEGGAYRASAHAAIGLLAGGVSGALGAAASSALMPDIAEQIKKLGLPPVVESAVSLAAASAIGTAVGGGAGAASAYNVDLNNRQASPAEIDKIKQLADGDPKKEARLQAAACALFRCWQEFAPGTPEYANAKSMGDWGNSAYVAAEYKQLELARNVGLFDYGAPDLALDVAKLAKNTVVQLAQDFGQLAVQIATHGPNALPPDLPPRDPWDTGGPSGTAVAVVTPPVVACIPGAGCVATPPVAMPGYVYASTGNSDAGEGGSNFNKQDEQSNATSEGTANAATGSKLADDLAAKMAKPIVSDKKLAGLIDDLYRAGAKIGNGSTADAVRYERATGSPVGNVFHSQKAQDYSAALQKWLDANPAASFSDRSAAKNVLKDLQNSLNGK
nr:hemagglutinin repeat-containing protein [Herbaspirillum rubrisubalbicans]